MPKTPRPPVSQPLHFTPAALLPPKDEELLRDIKAASHLKRITPAAFLARAIAAELGPQFAPQVTAAA